MTELHSQPIPGSLRNNIRVSSETMLADFGRYTTQREKSRGVKATLITSLLACNFSAALGAGTKTNVLSPELNLTIRIFCEPTDQPREEAGGFGPSSTTRGEFLCGTMSTAKDTHARAEVSTCGRTSSVRPSSSASSLPRVDSRRVTVHRSATHLSSSFSSSFFSSSSSRTHSLFHNFSTARKQKWRTEQRRRKRKGHRASAFIAENGIKARWKRASVVFRGLDGRIRRMDVGRLARIYPSIHPRRNSERYGGYIFQFLSRRQRKTYLP